jgi:PAS domain S-box-containing protein
VLTKSGEEKLIRWRNSLLRDNAGRVIGTLSSGQDMTDRRRAEEQLREYEKAVEGLEEMIVVVDRGYRYRLANRAYVNYRGGTREQLIGKLIPEVLGDEVFERVIKGKLDECLQGKVVKFELKYAFRERNERDLSVSYFPIEGLAGIDRVAAVIQDVTERKRGESDLRRLSSRLLHLQEWERRRIARDLHDDIGQDLYAARMSLRKIQNYVANQNAKGLLSEVVETIGVLLSKVRTLAQLLHPAELTMLGLRSAIVAYVESFRERSGVLVTTEMPKELPVLPRAAEAALYRVVQECLLNIQRHSGSPKAEVRIETDFTLITLEVKDDGVGMKSAVSQGWESGELRLGVGLAGMSERIKQLGGSVEITSGKWGTSVRATILLDSPELKSDPDPE